MLNLFDVILLFFLQLNSFHFMGLITTNNILQISLTREFLFTIQDLFAVILYFVKPLVSKNITDPCQVPLKLTKNLLLQHILACTNTICSLRLERVPSIYNCFYRVSTVFPSLLTSGKTLNVSNTVTKLLLYSLILFIWPPFKFF